jgi:Dolichyl-phosphate-mannose-protein mannosyltransferase
LNTHPGNFDSALLQDQEAAREATGGNRFRAKPDWSGIRLQGWGYAFWILLICVFGLLHVLHLNADFPNHSPWIFDFAKYTDEGWWTNAAIRAHLQDSWYVPGDFNPAAAAPVWPFLQWIVFFFTGVSIAAARALAVSFFFANLVLSYLFLRARGPRWMALLAVTLLVTSPFLYSFSRLAILEPLLTTLTLAALNLAVRLPRFRRPAYASMGIGLLFTLMLLTKTTAVFLLPAIGWAVIAPLWRSRRVAIQCAAAAAATSALSFGLWLALIVHFRLMPDFRYLFIVNKYSKPPQFYWPLLSFWWSLRGALWADRILLPLAALVLIAGVLAWRSGWSRRLWRDPAFGSSVLAAAGYILFMTYQNHSQPRYYAIVAFFSFFILATGIAVLLSTPVDRMDGASANATRSRGAWNRFSGPRLGYAFLAAAAIAACVNAEWTLDYSLHPEYTFVPAVENLTRYIDQHPNGNRLLLSTSSDEITLISRLPTICDDFGTQDLVSKLKAYQPGWFATWNVVDPGTLEDLHSHYSLEQVASFRALDHPDRNLLVLFKLRPLPHGILREPSVQNLQVELPGDKIDIPIE